MARAKMRTMTEESRKRVGDNIRERMAVLGLTQTGIERAVGIRQSVVSKYVTGSVDMRLSALIVMCNVLECTPNDLLDGAYGERSDG